MALNGSETVSKARSLSLLPTTLGKQLILLEKVKLIS
jgi:hypothetical protein